MAKSRERWPQSVRASPESSIRKTLSGPDEVPCLVPGLWRTDPEYQMCLPGGGCLHKLLTSCPENPDKAWITSIHQHNTLLGKTNKIGGGSPLKSEGNQGSLLVNTILEQI